MECVRLTANFGHLSKNPRAGTLETKNLTVNKEIDKLFLLDRDYPAIHQNWPHKRVHVLVIQYNAPVNVALGSAMEKEEGVKHRWNLELVNQPSNSPDFNILD